METDNEIIKVFFNAGQENIDWTRRTPRIINDNNSLIHIKKQQPVPRYEPPPKKELPAFVSKLDANVTFDPTNINKYLDAREIEVGRKLGSKDKLLFLDRLDNVIKLLNEVDSLCETREEYIGYIKRIDGLKRKVLGIKPPKQKKEKEKSNTVKQTKSTNSKSNKINIHTKRGNEIQNRLIEIKKCVKSNAITVEDYNNLKTELNNLRYEMENGFSKFSTLDNIPIKLSQVENYLSKLELNKPNISVVVTENSQESDSNGQTQRGIAIQKELSELRDEVKRKDLNPIEKENLTNILISLKNEIETDINKFSKFDGIPVRLNQIENYIEKLKDPIISESKSQIEKMNTNKNNNSNVKKEKPKVIWKFGL